MASKELNPDVPGSEADIPSALNASRGQEGSRAVGTAISGIGDVLAVKTKGTDQDFAFAAKTEVRDLVTDTRDIFIDADGNTAAGRTGLPPTAEATLKKMQTIGKGYQQGTVKESHYWRLMDMHAKQVRARYPGYREVIDAEVSRILGTTPANALLRSLKEEAQANTSDFDKRYEKAWLAALETGDPELAVAFQTSGADIVRNRYRSEAGIQALQKMVFNKNAKDRVYQDVTREYTVEEQQNKTVERTVEKTLAGITANLYTQLDSTLKGASGGKDSFKLVEEALQSGDPARLENARKALNPIRVQFLKMFEDNLQRPIKVGDKMFPMSTFLKPEVIKQNRQAITQVFDNLSQAINGKDSAEGFSALDAAKKTLDAYTNGDKLRLMQNYTTIRAQSAVRNVLGDTWVAMYANQVGIAPIVKDMEGFRNELIALTISSTPVGKMIDDVKQATGRAPTVNDITTARVNALVDPNGHQVIKRDLVEGIFGSKNDITERLSKEDSIKLLNKVSSPSVVQAVAELDKKEPGQLNKMYNWVTKEVLANNTVVIDGLAQASRLADEAGVKIAFDKATGQFRVNAPSNETVLRNAANSARGSIQVGQARRAQTVAEQAVNRVNDVIRPMFNVLKHEFGTSAGDELIARTKDFYGIDFGNLGAKEPGKAKADDRLPSSAPKKPVQ